MTPVIPEWKLKKKQYPEILKAQFHKLLDVKYALHDGTLWSVFLHPLAELKSEQLESSLKQVFNAAETFGTTYSSSNLSFGAPEE